jgi:hypothetical protein
VKSNVPRAVMGTIAPINALVRMEAIVLTLMDNANVPLDGLVYFANHPVGQDSMVNTVKSSAIVKTELHVITSQVKSNNKPPPNKKLKLKN